MKKVLSLLLVVLFLGCGSCQVPAPSSKLDVSEIQYTKDPRTGICYAYTGYEMYAGNTGITITCVPCDCSPD